MRPVDQAMLSTVSCLLAYLAWKQMYDGCSSSVKWLMMNNGDIFNECRLIDVLKMAIDVVSLNITATYLPLGLQQMLWGRPPISLPSTVFRLRSAIGKACFGIASAIRNWAKIEKETIYYVRLVNRKMDLRTSCQMILYETQAEERRCFGSYKQ